MSDVNTSRELRLGRMFVRLADSLVTGFDVVEIGGRHGNQPFQWQLIANRADEQLGAGRLSRNADTRFEPVEEELEAVQVRKSVQ